MRVRRRRHLSLFNTEFSPPSPFAALRALLPVSLARRVLPRGRADLLVAQVTSYRQLFPRFRIDVVRVRPQEAFSHLLVGLGQTESEYEEPDADLDHEEDVGGVLLLGIVGGGDICKECDISLFICPFARNHERNVVLCGWNIFYSRKPRRGRGFGITRFNRRG